MSLVSYDHVNSCMCAARGRDKGEETISWHMGKVSVGASEGILSSSVWYSIPLTVP